MKTVNVKELKAMMDAKEDFVLIDVREQDEYAAAKIEGSTLIPLATVPQNLDKFPKDKKVIVQCRSGARSGRAVQFLMQNGYNEVYNLEGGIMAWAAEIDGSLNV